METYKSSLCKGKEIRINENVLYYTYFSRQYINWADISICLLVKDSSSSWKENLKTWFYWVNDTDNLDVSTTPKSYKEAIEIVNQPIFTQLMLAAYKETMTKKNCNNFCKIIANTDKECRICRFKFDCNAKLSKIFNSISSLKVIDFDRCNFNFKGDLKFNRSAKYNLRDIWIHRWTFTSHSFKTLIRLLAQISKSAEFKLGVSKLLLPIDDEECESIIKKLNMKVKKLQNNLMISNFFRCDSSCFKNVIDAQE